MSYYLVTASYSRLFPHKSSAIAQAAFEEETRSVNEQAQNDIRQVRSSASADLRLLQTAGHAN